MGLRRTLVRSLLAVFLLGLSVVGAVTAYLRYCQVRRLDVLPMIRTSPIARRLFLSSGYQNLITKVAADKRGFETLWDATAPVSLDSRLFEPTEMYGRRSYRYRPHLRLIDATVWSGLEYRTLVINDDPVLVNLLSACPELRRTTYETDAYGFKRTEFAIDGSTPTVLFLGDSFTEGLHVTSERTFVDLFGHRMRESGIHAVPVNGGVSGYSPLEESWTAERFAPRLDSRVIVLSLYPNDVDQDERAVINDKVPEAEYVAMLADLDRLERQCRAEQRQLVVAVIPNKRQVQRAHDPIYFQRRVRRWCARNGVLFLDPLPLFRERRDEKLFFSWDPHLSETGHRVYADFLFDSARPVLEKVFPRGVAGTPAS